MISCEEKSAASAGFAAGLVAVILRYPAVYGTKTAVVAGISMDGWRKPLLRYNKGGVVE